MKKLRVIYRRGEIEELSNKTGIFEGHFVSWLNTSMKPKGTYLTDLQKYFDKN